tara:strand:+ start:55013 stop:55132 length:120 start_codon:yes stop_codon:yes gene_type:complete
LLSFFFAVIFYSSTPTSDEVFCEYEASQKEQQMSVKIAP